MNIYETMFLISFLVAIGVLIYQLYNLYQALTLKEYSILGVIASFVLNLIAWFVNMVVFLKYPQEIIYSINMIFISLLLPLNILFALFSGFFVFIKQYLQKKGRYAPN